MTVTQDQIKKIAKNLSKIGTSGDKIIEDIQAILSYVELLNEVDTAGVEPTISVVQDKHVLRNDKEEQRFSPPEELLKCSPQKVIARQVSVGGIME